MKDVLKEKLSGPAVYVKRELAIIRFCAIVAKNESVKNVLGHMNIMGPQLFHSFFFIRWMKVVRIGALFADWSCAS